MIAANEMEAFKKAVSANEWAPEGIELFEWRQVPATVGRVNAHVESDLLDASGNPIMKAVVISLDHRIAVHDGPVSEIKIGFNTPHRLVAWSAR